MRKLWCALAGGIVLFAASPAQADALPGAAAAQPADRSAMDRPSDPLPARTLPDVSGMPLGGVLLPPLTGPSAAPTLPAADVVPAPRTTAPAHSRRSPRPKATPYDPRLFEEPVEIDDEPEHRPATAATPHK
ncbi:hypothetical protein [Actinoplanes sp. URMC 104]|uniref:hypothetical protein n=1 Tax=Actinoplanes sp. URMC 104 TaxID=3423409 RepID=UPI003F1D105D